MANYISGLLLAIVLFGNMAAVPATLHLVLLLASAAFFVYTLNYLYRDTHLWQFGNAPDEQLDERQVQVRNKAYRLAYTGMASIFMLTAIYYTFAVDLNWWVPKNWEEADMIVWLVIFLTLTLPSSILAWMEEEV